MNNLSPKISKLCLSSRYQSNLQDEHVTALVSRCNNIETLDLGRTGISSNSVTTIIDHLKPSLQELGLNEINVDVNKLLELKSMPKLKLLQCEVSHNELKYLKEQIPHVKIIRDGNCIDIF